MPQTYRQLLDDYAKKGVLDQYRAEIIESLGPESDPMQFGPEVMNSSAKDIAWQIGEFSSRARYDKEAKPTGKTMSDSYRALLHDYAKRGELDNYREGVVATLGPNNDPLQFDDSVMNADAQVVLGKLSEYQAKHTKGYEVDRSGKQHVGPMAAGVANRAEWLKEAGIGLAEGAATAIPYAAATIGAGVVAPLTDGMSVREMADKAAASGSAPVKAVGEFFVDADKQIKDGQRDYNKEMLDLPLPERLSRSASNILGGLGTLAVAPLGFGEMGSPERARDLGKGLVQGPVGYYAGVLDPTMAVDTVAADPFAAILEVAPLATAVGSSARAAGAASKNAKAAKTWLHLANIVDPQVPQVPQDPLA